MPTSRALEGEAGAEEGAPGSRLVLVLLVAMLALTLAMMLVSFPVGLYTVFGTSLSNSTGPATQVAGVELDLLFATVLLPLGGSLGAYFLFVTAVCFLFLVVAARQGTGVLRAMRGALSGNYNALFANPLAATLVLLGAVSFITQLVDTAQTSAGVSTGSLSGDPFSLLVDFTLAPLLEETTFRVIMIGLPVLVLAVVMLREASPAGLARALWRPSSLWDTDEDEAGAVRHSFQDANPALFPTGSESSLKVRAMRPVVYFFLGISSLIFGYAHYASGAGWGPGKISEAALAGVALGYLYIKYGFLADVLLHWSVNYVGSIYSFFAQGVYGISWTSATGSPLDWFPTLVMVFLLGVPSTYVVAKELFRKR